MAELTPAAFISRQPIFTTREFALLCGRRIASASRTLSGMAADGTIVRVTRGIWANPAHPHYSPLGAVPYLLGDEQGYVSFLSALHLHDVISQIPGAIQVATTGHGRKLQAAIGSFEFIRIQPVMMRSGIDFAGKHTPYLLARPEKALLDTLYVATRRGRRFSRLPETDLSVISPTRFRSLLAEQVAAPAIRSAIERRFTALLR